MLLRPITQHRDRLFPNLSRRHINDAFYCEIVVVFKQSQVRHRILHFPPIKERLLSHQFVRNTLPQQLTLDSERLGVCAIQHSNRRNLPLSVCPPTTTTTAAAAAVFISVVRIVVIDIPKPGGDHWHKVFGPFDSCKPRVWAIIRDDCVDTDGLGTVDCTLTCTEFGTERDAVDNINQQADGNYNYFLFNDSFEQLEHEQSCTTMWQNPDYPALGAGPLCDLHITNREAAAHEARMAEVHALAESCIIQRQQNLMPMMFDYGLPVEGHDDHFRIDHYTGELYFWDSAEYFEDHHVTFVTTHKDGAVVESNPISIRTRCGPTSTDIESLIIDSIVGDPSGLDFSLSAAFTSSNALCPIESQIISGAGGSRSTSVDVEDFYDFEDRGADGFAVTLKEDYQEAVGNYFYTIRATALGGADSDASGYMNVTTGKVDAACYNTRLLAPIEREIERTFNDNETVFSLTGTFKTTVIGCPIQSMSLSTESAQDFRLSFDGDRSFTIYRTTDDPSANDFTVFATAYGKSASFSGKFTYARVSFATVRTNNQASEADPVPAALAAIAGAACVLGAAALAGYWFCSAGPAKQAPPLPDAAFPQHEMTQPRKQVHETVEFHAEEPQATSIAEPPTESLSKDPPADTDEEANNVGTDRPMVQEVSDHDNSTLNNTPRMSFV